MMNGLLPAGTLAALSAAGIAISPERDALGPLLAAAEARGLAARVAPTRRSRRGRNAPCACYRARVRPLPAQRGGQGSGTSASRGWGENGAAALAQALLAWLA